MNRTAFKFAASTLIVAMTMAGFSAQSAAMRRLGNTVQADTPRRPAGRRAARPGRARAAAGPAGRGADRMEQAVALIAARRRLPHAARRHLSEERPLRFGPRHLSPTCSSSIRRNVRAGLSFALTQIAQGRPQAAVGRSTISPSRAPAADVGLAYALAGRTDRAIEHARSCRALADRRRRAPARISRSLMRCRRLAPRPRHRRAGPVAGRARARMQQWAAFARPGAGADPGRRPARRVAGRRIRASRSGSRSRPRPRAALAVAEAADPAPETSRPPRPAAPSIEVAYAQPEPAAAAAPVRSPRRSRPKRPLPGCRPRRPMSPRLLQPRSLRPPARRGRRRRSTRCPKRRPPAPAPEPVRAHMPPPPARWCTPRRR